MADPVTDDLSYPFPQIYAPFVNIENGIITRAWFELLLRLWNRTGAASGGGGSTTDIFNYVIADEQLPTERENASAGELGLLGLDGLQAAIIEEVSRQLLLLGSPPQSDPLASLLFETPFAGVPEHEHEATIFAPLVTGELPGPVLVATEDGQCIMVQVQ